MRKIILTMGLVLAACLSFGANLLTNPDFEELAADGMPLGWKIIPYKKDISLSWEMSNDAVSGKRAVLFKSIGQLEQYVTVPEPGQYKMSVMIKKSSPEPLIMGACYLNPTGWIIAGDEKRIGAGKPFLDWTEETHVFSVPPGNMKIRIFINGQENAAYDCFKLEKVGISADGELVMSDKLDSLSADWEIVKGTWECVNGALKGTGPNAFIRCKKPVGRNIRAEYTCWTDRPCDLSAVIGNKALTGENVSLNGYFFGFGTKANTMNSISRMAVNEKSNMIETVMLNRSMMEGFNTGIEPGKKHLIIVESRDGILSIRRDGKLELTAEDMFPDDINGEYFGFYVYFEGFFSDLKIHRLPDSKATKAANEEPVKEQSYRGFDDRALPAECSNAAVVDFQNWGYKENNALFKTVIDPALALNPTKEKNAFFRIDLPKTQTGIVELDILTEKLGNETRIALESSDNKELAAVIIGKDGSLFSDSAPGRKELLKYIEYRRRDNYQDEFKLLPNMWYTLRLKYDSESGVLLNTALIDFYTEDRTRHQRNSVDQGDYLPLGSSQKFKEALPAAKLSVSSSGSERVLLDNVTAFGPVGTRTVNGKLILLSARTLLDLKYEQRRDPMNLKLQSLRLFAPWPLPGFFYAYAGNEGKSSFQDAGKEYDQVLVRQGFLREQIDQMDRTASYRSDKGQNSDTVLSEIAGLRKKRDDIEIDNEKTLAALAEAFRSELSDDLLEKKYKPALAAWKEAVEKLGGDIQGVVSRLAKEESNSEPAPLPHEFSIGKYQYDFEKKLWTRDGKIEHYFHSMHAFRKWRENLLGFPAHWLSVETFFFGSDVKDGELLDMTALKRMLDYAKINTKRQGEPQDCFFWMQNGTHFCQQPIPDWCHEKYAKNDDDFYFCRQDGKPFANVAGNKMRTMKIASANFWNSSVKEIQRLRNFEVGRILRENPECGKPTLLLMGGEAFNMLDENQETGHNRSAVAAFQKILAEKHKSIDNLNKQWNGNYQNFSEITPPKARTEPSPLQYEFQKFRQSEYFTQFIVPGFTAIEDGYKEKLPAGLEMQYTFGSSYYDMTEFFDRVPVVLFHTYRMWDRKIYPRWLNYLSQASGKPWAAHEWGATEGSKTLYDMEWLRKHATREVSHQIMWRNAAPNKFENDRVFPVNWQYGLPIADYRLNNIVLSHFSTFWPVMKDRSLRFGVTALTAPARAA